MQGVFLFMGLVSLGTNQFWGRILIFFMQPSKYPLEPYTVHMNPLRMHQFTAIQLGLFILLFVVKSIKSISIFFPLIIALGIPIRLYLLPKLFSEKELVMIDSDDETIKKWLMAHHVEKEVKEGGKEESAHGPPKDEEEEEGGAGPPPALDDDDIEMQRQKEQAQLEEAHDIAMPLPTSTQRQSRRKRRTKAVSCPPHMLFAEVPFSATEIGVSVMEQVESKSATSDSEDSSNLPSPTPFSLQESQVLDLDHPHARRRRGRSKAVSCPPHMLFAEAERHLASNYFFG